MARLCVAVIARDEERDLPGCLESVTLGAELVEQIVVVVDATTTDRTAELARAAGAKVFVRPWPGFAAQRTFALEQATAEWVLFLDADERCSKELAAALPAALADAQAQGYSIPFETWAFGARLRHGGFARESHLRLFRRQAARFPAKAVHEGAVVEGQVRPLAAPIVHHTYDSLEDYFEKFNRYTSDAAKERYAAGARLGLLSVLRWPWGFFRRYVLQLGFLDGWAGLLMALLSGLYDFVKVAKLGDLERAQRARLPGEGGTGS